MPESLKNIECQEPSVVTSIEALDALIDSCDQPLDSLISGLEKQLMNAIIGLEVSARSREYRNARFTAVDLSIETNTYGDFSSCVLTQ